MSVTQHKLEAPKNIICKVITVSDTRSKETDKSGQLIIEMLQKRSHSIRDYQIVIDDFAAIYKEVMAGCLDREIDVILLNGGTGVAKRDVTIDVVESLIEKQLPGFGEIFRMLSYTEDIGSAAIMSRATAGIAKNTAVFSMPGSTGSVSLAMEKIILLEITHIVREIRKDIN
ncbi:MogA/MoaB family molybdenum cofactor biosynthesis protein [Metabacillus sp. SLBN-84]